MAAPALIVVVLLVAYDFIAQLVPAVVIGGVFWQRATLAGSLSGILVGWALSAALLLTKHSIVLGMNAGFIALCANLIVFFVVSLLTRPVEREILDRFFATIYGRWAPGPRAEVTAGVAADLVAEQASRKGR